MISKNEGIQLESPEVLDKLIDISEGDLRRSINTLQTCSSFVKGQAGKKLTIEDINKVSGCVPDSVIADIYEKIKAQGRGNGGHGEIQSLVQDLILEGYDVQQLLQKLMSYYISKTTKEVPDLQKAQISEMVAESDFKMIQGGDEELNLLHTLTTINLIVNGNKH